MYDKMPKTNVASALMPFLLVLMVLLCSHCKIESEHQLIIDNTVDILYANSLQGDLLDTAVSGSFFADSIHLYNVDMGVKTEVKNRNDYPNNFVIYKNEELQKYVLRVFLESDSTLLELNPRTTDTIKCYINRANDDFIISKVWYNGSVEWDDYATIRQIIIQK